MNAETDPTLLTFGQEDEKGRRSQVVDLLRNCPIPEGELLMNLGLFLTPQTLSRILFMDFLYKQILPVQGVVLEFGCRWGQNLNLFSALRGIYEPFNRLRKVVGFDTFEGLTATGDKDGTHMAQGMYGVKTGYETYLRDLLAMQEKESPLPHLKKHEVIKGDATKCIHEYFEAHPETIIALAYFDLDIYAPTKACLEAIADRLTIGSVLGFDELNDPVTPGETLALKEVFGLTRYSIRRFPHNSRTSYLVVE